MDDELQINLDAFYDEAKEQGPEENSIDSLIFQNLFQQEYRYIEICELGQGAIKTVSQVYDTYTRREVALATLHGVPSNPLIDSFIYEAWLTAQLDHPNIIKIHDLNVSDENIPFFTMDLKKGSSLKEILDSYHQDFSIKDRLEIFLKIGNAINYAHSRNILHLDLKPDNIQIGKYGEVIVCDWGLGQMTNSVETTSVNIDQELLNSELLLKAGKEQKKQQGTPGYMSPEQVGNDSSISPISDIYGLGALLYYMLTLQAPIKGKLHEILDKTLIGDIISPRDIAPDNVSQSLNAIVMKALATSKSRRYQTVEGLLRDVQQYLLGYAPSAEHASFSKEFALFCLRNKLIIRMFFAFLFTILTLIAVLFIYKFK